MVQYTSLQEMKGAQKGVWFLLSGKNKNKMKNLKNPEANNCIKTGVAIIKTAMSRGPLYNCHMDGTDGSTLVEMITII